MAKKISFIIATKNEEKNIGQCLKSLKRQTIKDIEIIVVDNYSHDQTIKIAEVFAPRIFSFGNERSRQRNFGARKTHSNYLVFIDADMELDKEVTAECLNLAEKGVGAIIIPEKINGQDFWTRCRALEKSCYLNDELIEAPRFIVKELFLKLGGYDEDLIAGEDWDLAQKIRSASVNIGRIQSFLSHNEKASNPWQAAKKKYYYGQNLSFYLRKHPELAIKQFQPFRRAFFRNFSKMLLNPSLALGLVVLKMFDYVGGGAGILRGKLK